MTSDAADSSAAERRALRREYRTARRALPLATRRAAAESAARVLANSRLLRPGARVAAYLPADAELDPGPIVALARARGCRVYVPVIVDARAARMRFGPIDAPRPAWRVNRYGHAEPGRRPALLVSAPALDLVLVPLVAFDSAGNRLGMGAGYYDRAFAFLRHRSCWQRPRLVGLAYDRQRAPSLPAAPWDVPLWGVLTESGLHRPPVAENP